MTAFRSAVEDLLVQGEVWSGVSSAGEVALFGEPLHRDATALLASWRESSLDSFLASEARHSIGNYALVWRKGRQGRILTSPGYCGGYVWSGNGRLSISTLLAPALAGSSLAADEFGLSFYLTPGALNPFGLLPFSTMFRGLRRLPPASLLEFDGGEVTRLRCYLLSGDEPPPYSFLMAMSEISESLAGHFSRNPHQRPALLFSGGVDSLSIYFALREAVGADRLHAMTMDHSDGNGPPRALPVARSVGFEPQRVIDQAEHDGEVVAWLQRVLSLDTPAAGGPHMSLVGRAPADTILFHGQNFDAVANVKMTVLQQTLDRGFLSGAAIKAAGNRERLWRQLKAFLGNLQFTDGYLRDTRFQKLSLPFFGSLLAGAQPDPNPGMMGVLRGMISSEFPNLLSRADSATWRLQGLDREVGLLADFAEDLPPEPRVAMDLLRFAGYCHYCNKRIMTFPVAAGTRPLMLAMSGPILSYFLGRPRGMAEASEPKREIYAYARTMGGKAYRDMTRTLVEAPMPSSNRTLQRQTALLRSNRAVLSVASDRLQDLVEEPFRRRIASVTARIRDGDIKDRRLALRLLNLGLLLESVDRSRACRDAAQAAAEEGAEIKEQVHAP